MSVERSNKWGQFLFLYCVMWCTININSVNLDRKSTFSPSGRPKSRTNGRLEEDQARGNYFPKRAILSNTSIFGKPEKWRNEKMTCLIWKYQSKDRLWLDQTLQKYICAEMGGKLGQRCYWLGLYWICWGVAARPSLISHALELLAVVGLKKPSECRCTLPKSLPRAYFW